MSLDNEVYALVDHVVAKLRNEARIYMVKNDTDVSAMRVRCDQLTRRIASLEAHIAQESAPAAPLRKKTVRVS